MSKVFYIPCGAGAEAATVEASLHALWEAARFGDIYRAHDLTAIKIHVGEPGRETYIPAAVIAPLVRAVAATHAHPFLTDTAVLYRSRRDNGVTHAHVAHEHGFSLERTGAPFIPADGITGSDERAVAVRGKHYQEVALASGILHASSVLCVTHPTGHLGTGFGGTLKNLGMGCCSRKAKLRQHHGQQPFIVADACTACGACATWCPTGALQIDALAVIDGQRCIGCGECIAMCREGAVQFNWGIMGQELQERIVEHAAGVVQNKQGRMGYVAVAWNITKDCDCLGLAQEPLVEDLGLLVACDPVALDQAVLDLIRQRAGQTLESMSYPGRDGSLQLQYAEELGLGSRSYQLERLTL